MARRRRRMYDDDGLLRVDGLKEFPQLRDGMGRTQIDPNATIKGAARVSASEAEVLDLSLETFRQGIRHWSRFNSIYRQVASMKRREPTRTAPELLTSLLLSQRGIRHMTQQAVLGGKLASGGGILDFVIPDRGLGLNIHGAYYHDRQKARTEWLHLVGQDVGGVQLRSYEYLFDDTLYRGDDGVALDYVLAGVGIGR